MQQSLNILKVKESSAWMPFILQRYSHYFQTIYRRIVRRIVLRIVLRIVQQYLRSCFALGVRPKSILAVFWVEWWGVGWRIILFVFWKKRQLEKIISTLPNLYTMVSKKEKSDIFFQGVGGFQKSYVLFEGSMSKYLLFLIGVGGWSGKGQKHPYVI